MSTWVLALALLGAVAYAVLCHLLMVHAAASPWAIAVVLGPLGLVAGVAAWRARQWLVVAALAGLALLLVLLVPRGSLGDPGWLYLAQHAGTHAAMGVAFAATLRRPLSLIGQLAQSLHPLTPDMVRYTRAVTMAWVAYFFGMAVVSVALFVAGAREAWSLLATVGTPLLVAALMVGEYLLRYRLHPEFERVPFRDMVGAWRAQQQRQQPGASR